MDAYMVETLDQGLSVLLAVGPKQPQNRLLCGVTLCDIKTGDMFEESSFAEWAEAMLTKHAGLLPFQSAQDAEMLARAGAVVVHLAERYPLSGELWQCVQAMR